jgi:cell division protein FtsZ
MPPAQPDPVAAEPAAPAAPEVAATAEPTFFDSGLARERAEDELPAPAYRPQPATAQRDFHVEDEASAFVAPRPRAPGTPSPEALARLQAAVNRAPAPRTAMQPPPVAAPDPQQAAATHDRPRFGINSLINRMTGGPSTAAHPSERAMPSLRPHSRDAVAYDEEAEANPEQERIDIPAFLRRQAN